MGATSSPGLRRTESILLLPTPPVDSVPYSRTLSYYKEQRQQHRRKMSRAGSSEQLTIRTTRRDLPIVTPPMVPLPPTPTPTPKATRPPIAPSKVILPSASNPVTTYITPRRSSPLSPNPQCTLPGRPVFPRSKPCQNLYKTAIKMRMLTTEEGKKILSLGPRLAMEIMQTSRDILRVTKELEMMVGDEDAEGDEDEDVVMWDATPEESTTPSTPAPSPVNVSPPPTPRLASTPLPPLQPLLASYARPPSPPLSTSPLAPPVLTTSWVVVKGGEDWEMVDCAA